MPPYSEGFQVHEVKTLVSGTVIFKAHKQKTKKLSGIIYVLMFFA